MNKKELQHLRQYLQIDDIQERLDNIINKIEGLRDVNEEWVLDKCPICGKSTLLLKRTQWIKNAELLSAGCNRAHD